MAASAEAQSSPTAQPLLPLTAFLSAGPVDVASPSSMPPAKQRYPNGLMTWPYPLIQQDPPLLPQIIPAAGQQLLAESLQGFFYVQRIYADRMEFWWLLALDEAKRRASLCHVVLRPDQLPAGSLLTNFGMAGLLAPGTCTPRAIAGVPPAFLGWQRPRPEDMQQPPRTFASARFAVGGVTWRVSIQTAQRGTPANFAFHTTPWSRQDWRMVAKVPAPLASNAAGVKDSYFEVGLPHDARGGIVLRFSEPDMVKAWEDPAYRLAVCRLEADRADAPLPQDARLLDWCAAQVLKAGRQVPETLPMIVAPPGVTAPPR